MEKQFRHLPLEKAYNVRDIGGYPCSEGNGITNYHAFLRADDMHYLSDKDIAFLKEYGLVSVIDLRSKEEIEHFPDAFLKYDDIKHINIPFVIENISDVTRIDITDAKNIMPEFYIALLKESSHAVKAIFDYIAVQEEGTVLFHCTAGKDRTGMTAMLLLKLAGVQDTDVIADYIVTQVYNSVNSEFAKAMESYQKELILSDADYIMPALDYIKKEYGTAYQYLKEIGVSEENLSKVITRICG